MIEELDKDDDGEVHQEELIVIMTGDTERITRINTKTLQLPSYILVLCLESYLKNPIYLFFKKNYTAASFEYVYFATAKFHFMNNVASIVLTSYL